MKELTVESQIKALFLTTFAGMAIGIGVGLPFGIAAQGGGGASNAGAPMGLLLALTYAS